MERWQQVHENRASEEDLTKLRRCTYSGRPFGDESFLSALEGQFHRRWRRFKLEAESASSVETAQTSAPRLEF
jgi:putative transposase